MTSTKTRQAANVYLVEVVEVDEFLAELDSSDGVSHLVQGWRPEGDPHDVRDDQHEGATHARLGGKADLI